MTARLKCDPKKLPVPRLAPSKPMRVDIITPAIRCLMMSFGEQKRRQEEWHRMTEAERGKVCGDSGPGSDGPGISCDRHSDGSSSES